MDLGGTWRAAAANDQLRRTFHAPDHDDAAWTEVLVPGHWADVPELANEQSVLYRHHFEGPAGKPVEESEADPDNEPGARRWWLTARGIAQQGHVWLDAAYLGATDGYFVPHQFEVTNQINARKEHVLAVDTTCRQFGDPDNRSSLTGALQDPELCGSQGLQPGGIWQSMSLRSTGQIAILHSRAVCIEADTTRGRLALRAVLDVPDGGPVELRARISGREHIFTHHAALGENRVEWTIDVDAPQLWWPHSLGDQPLYDLAVDVLADGQRHDSRTYRIGFRTVRLRNWVAEINGERLFLKGVNTLPTRPLIGDATPAEIAGDVRAARSAGLDIIRPIAHVARRELYETADETGLLVWQDLPLRGVMSRGTAGEARRQAREIVDLLGHHPSVAVWCAHDEPFPRPERKTTMPPVFGQQKPSWNRAVLDRSLCRIIDRCDPSRPVIPHTAVPPHLPTLDGTTSNLWFGWHGGRAADLAHALSRVPRMGRFVTAFGAACVDPDAVDDRWPRLDWDDLAERCAADALALQRLVPTVRCDDGPEWAAATRGAQAEVIKTTIETLRRLKYLPTGGFMAHVLADPTPTGGFGLLDHDRRPKPAWHALVDACRPVVVIADPLPPLLHPHDRLDLAVHVVSDLRVPIDDVTVRAQLIGPAGVVCDHQWGGSIPADTCEFVGRVQATITDESGRVTLELSVSAGDITATNRYTGFVH